MTRSAKILTYAILCAWAVVCLFPLYWIAVSSVKTPGQIMQGPYYLPFGDFIPSLDAWRFILGDDRENLVWRFINSATVALAATLLCLIFGGMAAYGISRFRVPWISGGTVMTAILATRILPPAVLVLPFYFMAHFANLLDTRTALIAAYTAINLPVAAWLLQPVFGPKASDQEEAAFLDGASRFRVFFEIAVPMAAAGLAASGLLIFVLCWNEYLLAANLAADHAMTLPPWMVGQLSMKEAQVGGEDEEWAHLSAATVLMTAPLLLFVTFVQRALARVV